MGAGVTCAGDRRARRTCIPVAGPGVARYSKSDYLGRRAPRGPTWLAPRNRILRLSPRSPGITFRAMLRTEGPESPRPSLWDNHDPRPASPLDVLVGAKLSAAEYDGLQERAREANEAALRVFRSVPVSDPNLRTPLK